MVKETDKYRKRNLPLESMIDKSKLDLKHNWERKSYINSIISINNKIKIMINNSLENKKGNSNSEVMEPSSHQKASHQGVLGGVDENSIGGIPFDDTTTPTEDITFISLKLEESFDSIEIKPEVPTCEDEVKPEVPTCEDEVKPEVPTCEGGGKDEVPTDEDQDTMNPEVSTVLETPSPRSRKKTLNATMNETQLNPINFDQQSFITNGNQNNERTPDNNSFNPDADGYRTNTESHTDESYFGDISGMLSQVQTKLEINGDELLFEDGAETITEAPRKLGTPSSRPLRQAALNHKVLHLKMRQKQLRSCSVVLGRHDVQRYLNAGSPKIKNTGQRIKSPWKEKLIPKYDMAKILEKHNQQAAPSTTGCTSTESTASSSINPQENTSNLSIKKNTLPNKSICKVMIPTVQKECGTSIPDETREEDAVKIKQCTVVLSSINSLQLQNAVNNSDIENREKKRTMKPNLYEETVTSESDTELDESGTSVSAINLHSKRKRSLSTESQKELSKRKSKHSDIYDSQSPYHGESSNGSIASFSRKKCKRNSVKPKWLDKYILTKLVRSYHKRTQDLASHEHGGNLVKKMRRSELEERRTKFRRKIDEEERIVEHQNGQQVKRKRSLKKKILQEIFRMNGWVVLKFSSHLGRQSWKHYFQYFSPEGKPFWSKQEVLTHCEKTGQQPPFLQHQWTSLWQCREAARTNGDVSVEATKTNSDVSREATNANGDVSRKATKTNGDVSRKATNTNGNVSRKATKTNGDVSRKATKTNGNLSSEGTKTNVGVSNYWQAFDEWEEVSDDWVDEVACGDRERKKTDLGLLQEVLDVSSWNA